MCVNRFKLIMSTFLMKTVMLNYKTYKGLGLTDNHLMENLICSFLGSGECDGVMVE